MRFTDWLQTIGWENAAKMKTVQCNMVLRIPGSKNVVPPALIRALSPVVKFFSNTGMYISLSPPQHHPHLPD